MKLMNYFAVAILGGMLYACGGAEKAEETTTQDTVVAVVETPKPTLADGAYAIVLDESSVEWKAKKVTGEHYGTLKLDSGMLSLASGAVASGMFSVNMTSITVSDIDTAAKENADLVGHLKSKDFFAADKFKSAMFTITSVTADTIKGKLTIKGKTNEVAFPITVETVENNVLVAKGTAMVDRTTYDIKYGSGKFFKGLGDKMIDDMFEVKFTIKAKM
jgi:polyisoprenoid-binding protein YceI